MKGVLSKGTKIKCVSCGYGFLLDGKAFADTDADGKVRVSLAIACPRCNAVAKHEVIQDGRSRRTPSDKADRIQSTMRYDPIVYKFINDVANETGLSIADLVNEMLLPYMNDRKGMTQEIVERLQSREEV